MHAVFWAYRVAPGAAAEFEALYYSAQHYVRLKDAYLAADGASLA